MKAMTKGLLTIAMLAATAACDGAPTASNSLVAAGEAGPAFAATAPSSSLTFSSTQSQTTATPQSATGGTGSINFAGTLTTGTPCVDVTASHTDKRGVITVTVTATGNGGFCTQVVTNNNYQGAVTGLAAGSYTFNVVHVVDGSSSTAYSSTVVVR
jgi:hypothetical protein